MIQGKNKKQALVEELIVIAGRLNIEVRTERLLRESGYHVRSGRCRLKGKEMIILDRDAKPGAQLEFLAAQLNGRDLNTIEVPPHLEEFLKIGRP